MNNFHYRPFFAFLLILLSPGLIVSQDHMQDVVYLKNGSIIRGVIIEQVPGKSIKIQTRDGSVFVYTIDEIERMTKGQSAAASGGPATGGIGIAGNVATDVTGGLGFGGGLSYVLVPGGSSYGYEFSLDYFYHGYKEPSNGTTEEVDLSIFALRSNWLWSYQPGQSHVYFVTGVGFVVATLDWVQVYDPAVYGQALREEETYTSVGNVINLGIGYTGSTGVGVRLETPMLFFYSVGQAAAFVPTFSLGVKVFL